MKVSDVSVPRIEISKELEIINFKALQESRQGGATEDTTRHWISDDNDKDKKKVQDQFKSFQKAMRVLIVWGQGLGLNPVTGILQDDASKMRFTVCSLKFLFSMTMAVSQTIGLMLCVYKLLKMPSSIYALAFVTFYWTATCTTLTFIWIATKWPTLMKEIVKANLDEYIDPNIIKKCNLACVLFIGMAVMEHVLSIFSRLARIHDCAVNVTDYGQSFVKVTSPWLYELNVPYTEAVGVIVQYMNLITTATWNYADMFLVCMSLYLTSILERFNKRIILVAKKNYMPATIWGVLREDYTRATRLVRMFDDVISGIVLITFANDLFFICIQFYNVLANGIKTMTVQKRNCTRTSTSLLRGYEDPIYLVYSTMYLFVRFLIVSMVAARVNTASLVPARILYAIPSSAYTIEVERFLFQVNSSVVALSGLQFFYITKELILSIAGTIVTYELVLLQFNPDDSQDEE